RTNQYILCSNSYYTTIGVSFCHDTAATEIYTLSLHDALPISVGLKTDKNGYFYTSTAYGSFTITIEKEGYQTYQETVNHQGVTTRTFYLSSLSLEDDFEFLDEIIIDASINKIDVRKPEMSVNKLTAAEIKKMPVVLGETDILKSIL